MKNKIHFYGFVGLLCLPVLTFPVMKNFIDSENHENRQFAEKPVLSLDTITTYPEQYDTYFNDHLPYKNQLVMLNNIKNEVLGVGTTAIEYRTASTVIRGKDNWLFYNAFGDGENSFDDYMCNNLYTEEQMEVIAEGYRILQQELKQKYGSELVIMYTSNKEQIYPEYMPANIIPINDITRTEQLAGYLWEHTEVPLLYTKDALLEQKNHQLYYKYDTHWNYLGGFVGAQVLNQYFHEEYITLDEVNYSVKKDTISGDLADLLSMRKRYKDDKEWMIDDYKTDVIVETLYSDEEKDTYKYVSNAKDERSLLMVMDSFGRGMQETIPKDFAEVTMTKDTTVFRQLCEEMQPDIIVVEMVERRRGAQEELCLGLYDLLK